MPHRNYIDSHKVAIVCSARSGSIKTLGTTNLLLRAASEALKPRTKPASSGSATPVSMGLFGARRCWSTSESSDSRPRTPTDVHPRSSGPPSPTTSSPCNQQASAEPPPEYHVTADIIRREHLDAARSSIRDSKILKELEEEIERDCEWLRSFLLAAKACFI